MDVLNKRELRETSLDARATLLSEDPKKIRPNPRQDAKPKSS